MKSLKKKLFSLFMTLVIAAVFAPMMAQDVYAGGDADLAEKVVVHNVLPDDTVKAGTEVYILMDDLDEVFSDFSLQYNMGKVKCQICDVSKGTEGIDVPLTGGKFSYTIKDSDAGKKLAFYTVSNGAGTEYNDNTRAFEVVSDVQPFIDIDGNMTADGKVTITGNASSYTFKELQVVDNPTGSGETIVDIIATGVSGESSFTKTLDMTKYDIGYHSIRAKLSNDKYVYISKVVPSLIYDKPSIKQNGNFFSTGSNYICFRPYFTVPAIYDGIYIQLNDGKKWGDVYGPFSSYSVARTKYFEGKTKIKANHTYKIRAFYAKNTKYAGKTYPLYGPYSNIVSVKTGKSSKLSVKTISAKATKTKKIKLVSHAHWDAGGKWHPYKEDYTWTTTYKVTVKLKKKPGTEGIYIGDKFVKGNKKTYTATFTDSGKLKGKKIKVSICSSNDTQLGAFGPILNKKVKVK